MLSIRYRMIVQKDHNRVPLFTRNGHDWSHRYPLIVEAALKNRTSSFVIDGEALLLGVDGVSDLNGLHSRRHDGEVQLCAFDILALDSERPAQAAAVDPEDEPGTVAGTTSGKASSLATSNRTRSDLTYSGRPVWLVGLKQAVNDDAVLRQGTGRHKLVERQPVQICSPDHWPRLHTLANTSLAMSLGLDLSATRGVGPCRITRRERQRDVLPVLLDQLLAVESSNVVGLRMMKLTSGGRDARDEAQLMLNEKIAAIFEASASLMTGGTAGSVIERYRQHVAANARRLGNHIRAVDSTG
jgi:hypothetical protein